MHTEKMRLSTTISPYLKKSLSFEEIAKIISTSGIYTLDFPFHAEGFYTANEKYFKNIKAISEHYELDFNQTHAPYNSSLSSDGELNELVNKSIECIKYTKILGAKMMVVHPLQHLPYDEKSEELFELNISFFNKLIPYAEKYDVKLALENLWQKNSRRRIIPSVCASPEDYNRYLNEFNSDYIVACLDIGHAILCNEDIPMFIKKLGKKLQTLHIHENDGKTDLHTLPYACETVDWESVSRALLMNQYEGDLTFETVGYLEKHEPELLCAATMIMTSVGEHIKSNFYKSV